MQTKEPGNPRALNDECFALQIRLVDLLERNERAITQNKLWASGFSTAGITGRLGAVARSQRNRRPIALSFSALSRRFSAPPAAIAGLSAAVAEGGKLSVSSDHLAAHPGWKADGRMSSGPLGHKATKLSQDMAGTRRLFSAFSSCSTCAITSAGGRPGGIGGK